MEAGTCPVCGRLVVLHDGLTTNHVVRLGESRSILCGGSRCIPTEARFDA